MTDTTNDYGKKIEKRIKIIFISIIMGAMAIVAGFVIFASMNQPHVTSLEQNIRQDNRIVHVDVTEANSRYIGHGLRVNVKLAPEYSSQQNQHDIGVEVLQKIYNSKEWISTRSQYIYYGSWTTKAPNTIYNFGGIIHSYDLQAVFAQPTER